MTHKMKNSNCQGYNTSFSFFLFWLIVKLCARDIFLQNAQSNVRLLIICNHSLKTHKGAKIHFQKGTRNQEHGLEEKPALIRIDGMLIGKLRIKLLGEPEHLELMGHR
jgi:hypothetical protein